MRAWLKSLAPRGLARAWDAWRLKRLYYRIKSLDESEYPRALRAWYRARTGTELNLDNPVTYDEKIQWIKLYGTTPEMGRLSDKYLVRPWVAERVGEDVLVDILGVWDTADAIDFDMLPNQFVLKATHGCGWNIIVADKSTIDRDAVRAQCAAWLETNYAFAEVLELQYQWCEPRIIAEAYLCNEIGDLHDYKFFCFEGQIACVGFVRGRMADSAEACYDQNWQKLPCTYYTHPRIEGEVNKPAGFERACQIARALSAGFEHVRVDLYILNDGSVRFGEMTFTTLSGVASWDPPEYNYAFGELIDLNAFPAWRAQHSGCANLDKHVAPTDKTLDVV